MADLIPPASAVSPPVVGTQPVNVFVKALEDATAKLKEQLGRKDVRDEIVSGVFTFFTGEFPAAAPVLGMLEPVLQRLAEVGAK